MRSTEDLRILKRQNMQKRNEYFKMEPNSITTIPPRIVTFVESSYNLSTDKKTI